MSWEDYLEQVYYNPVNAGSFSGPDKLYQYVRKQGKYVLSKYKIRKWLQRQEAYSLQKGVRRRFKRNKVIVLGIDDQWDADLMDMSKYSKQNDRVAFILIVIDIFSKFLWMHLLEDKKGQSVTAAFESILQEGRRPTRLRTDKGQEFRSRAFNAYLDDQNIEHLYAQNTEIKANYAERVIKTIKTKLYRFITYKTIVMWITYKILLSTITQHTIEQSECHLKKLQNQMRRTYGGKCIGQKLLLLYHQPNESENLLNLKLEIVYALVTYETSLLANTTKSGQEKYL